MSIEAWNTCLYAFLQSVYCEGSVMERLELHTGHLLAFYSWTGFVCSEKRYWKAHSNFSTFLQDISAFWLASLGISNAYIQEKITSGLSFSVIKTSDIIHILQYTYYTYCSIHTTPTTVYILHLPGYTYYTYHGIHTTPTAVYEDLSL